MQKLKGPIDQFVVNIGAHKGGVYGLVLRNPLVDERPWSKGRCLRIQSHVLPLSIPFT